jgi:hypothetical protein
MTINGCSHTVKKTFLGHLSLSAEYWTDLGKGMIICEPNIWQTGFKSINMDKNKTIIFIYQ